jgi:hypothetical protein
MALALFLSEKRANKRSIQERPLSCGIYGKISFPYELPVRAVQERAAKIAG